MCVRVLHRLHGYRLWRAEPKGKLPAANLTELACVVVLVMFPMLTYTNKASLLAPLVFALPVLVFAYQQGVVSRWLQTGPLQYLGQLSYSVYMIHYAIFVGVSQAVSVLEKVTHRDFHDIEYRGADAVPHKVIYFGNIWLMDAFVLGCMAVTVMIAAMTYRYYEDAGTQLL